MNRTTSFAATAAASSFALVASGWAQTTATTTAPVAAPSPVFGMMQGVFGLAIVLGLIFAAGWLLKRISPRGRTSGIVQVLGGASVGPREKVVVVRAGDRTLVLGVAPGHVGLLHVVAPGAVPETPAADASFGDRLDAAQARA